MADYRYTDLDNDPDVRADLEFLREMLAPFDPARDETAMPTPQQAREHIARVLAETRETREARETRETREARETRETREAREAKPAQLRPSTRPGRRHSRRRVLTLAGGGAVAAAAATAGLLALDLRRAHPAYAATPQALAITAPQAGDPGQESLEQLAAHAGNAGGATAVEHLVTDRWDLNSTIDGRAVTSAIIASRRQLWRTGAGRARTIDEYLPPQFPTAADRDNWRDAGSPRGGGETREDFPAGEFPAAFRGRPPLQLDALAQWLRRADTSDVAIINGTADLLNERVLTGPERATLLRVLARRTSLTYAGTTVDRAGRTGRAFTASSGSSGAQVTHLFVIDPGTATILTYEQILTAGGDALRVRRPAVISYRTYLTAEFVPAIP